MDRGLNYYYLKDRYNGVPPRPTLEKPRVFISHQKNDSDAARTIADYLQDAGIDVYFDQYDSSINRSDPQSVVNAIKRGIENSSHMLVLFSPNTFGSKWVPCEIGYAYNSVVKLNVLRLKGVEKDKLPEYLTIFKLVSDIWDLNQLISHITNTNREQLLTEGKIRIFSDSGNPLNRYMVFI